MDRPWPFPFRTSSSSSLHETYCCQSPLVTHGPHSSARQSCSVRVCGMRRATLSVVFGSLIEGHALLGQGRVEQWLRQGQGGCLPTPEDVNKTEPTCVAVTCAKHLGRRVQDLWLTIPFFSYILFVRTRPVYIPLL